jgi:hypothetical protein
VAEHRQQGEASKPAYLGLNRILLELRHRVFSSNYGTPRPQSSEPTAKPLVIERQVGAAAVPMPHEQLSCRVKVAASDFTADPLAGVAYPSDGIAVLRPALINKPTYGISRRHEQSQQESGLDYTT